MQKIRTRTKARIKSQNTLLDLLCGRLPGSGRPRIRMSNLLTTLRAPVIIGFILVLPLMGLELINRPYTSGNFPFPLFVLLWLLPVIFMLLLIPVVRMFRTEKNVKGSFSLLARVAVMIALAWFWIGIVLDQMPCFLGVPNCD